MILNNKAHDHDKVCNTKTIKTHRTRISSRSLQRMIPLFRIVEMYSITYFYFGFRKKERKCDKSIDKSFECTFALECANF